MFAKSPGQLIYFLALKSQTENIQATHWGRAYIRFVSVSNTTQLSKSLATSYYHIDEDICGRNSGETGGTAE